MRDAIHRMSSSTPIATHGWNSTVMYASGVASSAGMPRFMKKLPNTLLNTTTVAQIQVFSRRRASSVFMPESVAGDGSGRGGGLLLRHELLPLGAQRHVLPGFFGEPAALFAVEHGLAHDAPDHARAEEILA